MTIRIEDAPPGSLVVMTNGITLHMFRWTSETTFEAIDAIGERTEFDVILTSRVSSSEPASVDIWRKLLTIIPDRRLASELLDSTDLRGREFWRHYCGFHPGTQPWARAAQEAIFELAKDPLDLMEEACLLPKKSSA